MFGKKGKKKDGPSILDKILYKYIPAESIPKKTAKGVIEKLALEEVTCEEPELELNFEFQSLEEDNPSRRTPNIQIKEISEGTIELGSSTLLFPIDLFDSPELKALEQEEIFDNKENPSRRDNGLKNHLILDILKNN